MSNDFALEKRLYHLDKNLHARFADTVLSIQHILSNYQLIFPDFTDHTELHTLNIIDFCNALIGDQLNSLNADEIYCVLLGCYFHDSGMGVSERDFEEFSKNIEFGDYFQTHSRDNKPEIIRSFHNEFSGQFIRKYARFFDFPSEQHMFAIIQISRGHRKTNLLDRDQYPLYLDMPSGNKVCLPYLSALVRLADEIDVTASRNSSAIYDLSKITGEIDIIEFMKHEAVKGLEIEKDQFTMFVQTDDEEIYERLCLVASKMQKTLLSCKEAVKETPYSITQERVVVKRI